jgi:hypothetical protein
MMINGFLIDSAVLDKSGNLFKLAELTDKCGVMDAEMVNMFVSPAELLDKRSTRLAITFRPTTYINVNDPTQAGYDNVTNITQSNNTYYQSRDTTVVYDEYTETQDETNYAGETLPGSATSIDGELSIRYDVTKVSTAEASALENISSIDREKLFNIVEYIFYGTIITDTLSDINTVLNGTDYTGYVDGSIELSPYRSIVNLPDLGIHRFAPRHAKFKFDFAGVQIEFTIWFDRNDFRFKYTEYTVTDVLFPLAPNILLNPSAITDKFDMANTALLSYTNKLVPAVSSENHTGYIGLSTRYIFNGVISFLTFGLMFKGRFPNIFEIKANISQALIDTGIGDLETWKIRLPDLFVENQFYFIPMWDNIHHQINTDIYPSIIANITEDSNVNVLASNLVEDTTKYEIITVPYDKLFIASLPNDSNTKESLKEIHPTYRDFSSTEPEFNYMEEKTRQFSILLNNVLAIAAGELNNNTNYANVTIDGKTFLSLTYDGTEYLVMTKDSYLANI